MQVGMEDFLPCHHTIRNYPVQPLTLERRIHCITDFSSCRSNRFFRSKRERCQITCVRLRDDYDMTSGRGVKVHKPKGMVVLIHNACRSLLGYDVAKDALAHTYMPPRLL